MSTHKNIGICQLLGILFLLICLGFESWSVPSLSMLAIFSSVCTDFFLYA